MREKRMWEILSHQAVQRRAHMVRIENSVGAGQPDVNYCTAAGSEGWIELKVWPRALKPSQRIWIEDRVECGGRVWVMWYLMENWLLVPGAKALEVEVSHDVLVFTRWALRAANPKVVNRWDVLFEDVL